MKKILFASTALIAFGAVSAQAAEPIKLQLGGYSKWWVGYASQDDDYETANGSNFTTVDVQGDNEVFFKGSTTLDNGIKIGIDIQLEAGGSADNTGGDQIDESYVTVDGGFGRVILGSENNGAYLLHVSAPDAASNLDEAGFLGTTEWVDRPASVTFAPTTAIVTDGDAEKITYVSPSFAGFTVGGSYVPSIAGEDQRTVTNNSAVGGEAYGLGAAYNNTFGGVGVKVSGGWVTADAGPTVQSHDEYSTGAQVSYAGFTVGGSYRQIDSELNGGLDNTIDGNAWNVGVQYATGPFAVSLAYFKSTANGANGATIATGSDDDEVEVYQLSGKYNMGPGVDVLGTIGHAKFENETGTAATNNEGWGAMTALSLAF